MTSDFIPEIDLSRCIGCELCVRVCPTGALALIESVAIVAHPEACTYSGVCQEICPTEAISLTYEIFFVDIRREEAKRN
ncbi:MAG: 4Fe-4S binding protein [Anaerolineales bacterium]|nr:4Fe-4S binding protein [Anaerolineales bacterium]